MELIDIIDLKVNATAVPSLQAHSRDISFNFRGLGLERLILGQLVCRRFQFFPR
jgi:hypothetical protein